MRIDVCKTILKVSLVIILFSLFSSESNAQYYFGRNKVQYNNFQWYILKTEHFEIYFYPEMRELAEIGAASAEETYTFLEDNLIILSQIKNQIQLRPPSGIRKKEVFDKVMKLAKKQSSTYPFGVIDNQTKEWLSNYYPKLEFIPLRQYFDYIYLV